MNASEMRSQHQGHFLARADAVLRHSHLRIGICSYIALSRSFLLRLSYIITHITAPRHPSLTSFGVQILFQYYAFLTSTTALRKPPQNLPPTAPPPLRGAYLLTQTSFGGSIRIGDHLSASKMEFDPFANGFDGLGDDPAFPGGQQRCLPTLIPGPMLLTQVQDGYRELPVVPCTEKTGELRHNTVPPLNPKKWGDKGTLSALSELY